MRRFGQLVLNLDRRVIYTLVMLCVAGPLLLPVGMPFKNTTEVQRIYDKIESLPAGSAVVISVDYGPGSMAETHPIFIAALHHCFRKKLRPIITSLVPQGDIIARKALQQVRDTPGPDGQPLYGDLKSGEDYVFLGFKAGSSAVILALTQSFTGTFPQDDGGNATANMRIFQQVRKLSDTKLIFSIASVAMPEAWLAYGAERAGVPLAVSCTAVSVAQYYPYYRQGQFVGLSGGMKGSAEYEQLVGLKDIIGRMPDATQGLDAQSLVHVFIVLAIVIANIFFLLEKRYERTELRKA